MKRRIVGVMLATALMTQQFAGGIFYLDKRGTAVKAAEASHQSGRSLNLYAYYQRLCHKKITRLHA